MVEQAFIDDFKRQHPNVCLIAVTKYTDLEGVKAFAEAGITDFGENRADAIRIKQPEFPEATWHFIGHLQTNKVKQVLTHINVLHSLDRLTLALEIEKRAVKPLPCFIQVKTTSDDKYGCDPSEVDALIKQVQQLSKITVIGFMTMAAQHASDEEISESFQQLQALQQKYQFPYLSMGMSDDYKIATRYGATHVRLGRILYKGEVYESL